MKILVTGGAGFIGSHLCERLLAAAHEVFCVDNFITGSAENIEHLKGVNFHLITHDITQPPAVFTENNSAFKVDQIYHLASPASPVDYREIPLQTIMTNSLGTKNVLDLAGRLCVPFLLASTSEVYGNPQEHPQKESYLGNVNTLSERSCYNEGKRFAEALAYNYQRHFKFDLKIVRIFNTYGPRIRRHDGRVIPEFIRCALEGEPLQITGDGSQTRSFCYVDDMVDGLIKIMSVEEKEFVGAVNLGNPQEVSIKTLAEKIITLSGSDSIISNAPAAEDDPQKRCPDISLAAEKYGFAPKIGLDEGLQKTIQSFKK
ncbi:SDR family oxidoreductase [Patescibacteria group bacterium]|nr:SDR family oxidoreductase [Patescibacteria group bacterium]MBU1702960.1 SDR family oxidoreductase [Patescibacteria group bacterium]MBU1953968.1 SDR family oxidoreductase [Patescibacteria group bacterium]